MSLSFIKLDINIMNDSKIKQLRKMPAGNDMVVLWIGLLCLGMRSGRSGIVEIGDNIPYDAEMLSIEFDIEKRTVELALTIFEKFNMIEIFDGGAILICNFEKHQELGKIEKTKQDQRERTRKFRDSERQKQLILTNNQEVTENVTVTPTLPIRDVTKCNATDIDVDTEKTKSREDKTNTKNNTKENISVFDSTLNDFYDMRKKIRAPMTDRAKKILVNGLEKLAPNDESLQIEILEQSIVNSWKSVFPLKEPKKAFVQQSMFGNKPQQQFGSQIIHKADLDKEMENW